MMHIPLPDPHAVAVEFGALLRDALTDAEYAECVRRNATDPTYADTDSCASHDFIDANELMLAAMCRVVGMTETDPRMWATVRDHICSEVTSDAAWAGVWAAAWELWRKGGAA